MVAKLMPDDQFIKAWQEANGSPRRLAEMTGISERAVYKIRSSLAGRGIILKTIPMGHSKGRYTHDDVGRAYKNQNNLTIHSGHVLVFSDAHWWPNHARTVANEALHELIKDLKPVARTMRSHRRPRIFPRAVRPRWHGQRLISRSRYHRALRKSSAASPLCPARLMYFRALPLQNPANSSGVIFACI